MEFDYLASIAKIIMIDIVLSGDNAVVIALAAHKLPAYQRRRAILWGGGIAILLRVLFTLVMAWLLMVPGVRLIGGIVLAWIACKLLLEEEEHEITPDNADQSAMAAIRMIFVADFMMSLDNMLAVAGASHGDSVRLLFGLLVSIGIIMTCSGVIARLMNRFHWIVWLGAAILAHTAADMMLGDREVASFIVRNYGVSLDARWEHDFMQTQAEVGELLNAAALPADLREQVEQANGLLIYRGQMTESQRDLLLAQAGSEEDRAAIDELYQTTRPRAAPGWLPKGLRSTVGHWFQLKWPIEYWRATRGREYHYVAWIFDALVIVFCLTFPWWRRRAKAAGEEPPAPASPH